MSLLDIHVLGSAILRRETQLVKQMTPGLRQLVTDILAQYDVPVTGTDGINLWMRVNDERSALITLAAQGIGAAPGEPFMVRDDADSLRITVGLLSGSNPAVAAVARQLANAAGFTPARSGQR